MTFYKLLYRIKKINFRKKMLSFLYRKCCEAIILLDIIWYQIRHIPWFLRNEFHVFQDITTNHHEFHSSHVKISKIYRIFNLVRNFIFHLVRAIFGASSHSDASSNNFILNYGMRYADQRDRQTLNEYIPMKVRQENLEGKKFEKCRVVIFLHGSCCLLMKLMFLYVLDYLSQILFSLFENLP